MGVDFDLTIEHAWSLFEGQNGRCALTNEPIRFESQSSRRKGKVQTASLDRIDSSKGYVEGNVWWVHKDVNRMKNDFPLDRFLDVCRKVASGPHGQSGPYGMSTSNVARTVVQ